VIGMLALEYNVISETVYVAVVFGAVLTSMISGPLMGRLMERIQRVDWLVHLPVDHILPQIQADTRDAAVRQLCRAAAGLSASLQEERIADAVIRRETEMTTAMNHGVAVPHLRVADLESPLIVFGRCPRGLDWNAQDDVPVRHIFLVLTPGNDPGFQLQVLRGIAETVGDADVRRRIDCESDAAGLLECLRAAFRPPDLIT